MRILVRATRGHAHVAEGLRYRRRVGTREATTGHSLSKLRWMSTVSSGRARALVEELKHKLIESIRVLNMGHMSGPIEDLEPGAGQ